MQGTEGSPEVDSSPSLYTLRSFIKDYRWHIFICLLASIINVGIDISLAVLVQQGINQAISGDHFDTWKIGFIALMIVVGFIVKYLVKAFTVSVSTRITRHIQTHIFDHLGNVKISFFAQHSTGDTVSRLTSNISSIQNFLQNDLYNLLYLPLLCVAATIYMLSINWLLFVSCIAIILVSVLLIGIISRPVSKYASELQAHIGRSNSISQDAYMGLHVIKAFGLKLVFSGKYRSAMEDALSSSIALEKRKTWMNPFIVLLKLGPFIVCILLGGYMVIHETIDLGRLTAFLQLLNYLVNPASVLPMVITNLRHVIGVSKHLFELLRQPTERADGNAFGKGSDHLIEFQQVSFTYDGSKQAVDNLSFKVRENTTTALVGASGSGKSTLFQLICGFYEPDQGCCKFYGRDIREWNLKALREQIAIVSQDVFLFPVTIAENLCYGRSSTTSEEMIEAAKAANAHEFIMRLPEGYGTVVGERGASLSGGQRQRLAIARAILKDAPVLLLDEATAALDMESEALVQEALKELMKDKTVLIIAHRLSTVRDADQILVLDQGTLLESGTYEELLKREGPFTHLFHAQYSA
ncbi:ABC transporter ATP-binding protein [Paenibacillus glufosinatiresistens]|uniref:ABC transporter ATP-binding protein n=1 Tax=Paenibacillus glufosinatiresistens TaxID=3070657 RepID=UPI00286E1D25|nr:ABC transporter ATP-binding protein [Paenibacillus sp. YX.27]